MKPTPATGGGARATRTFASGLAIALALGAATPALAQSPRLTAAAAVRVADQPLRLAAVGPITLSGVAVRTAAGWGAPYPVGVAASALVWHVTFRGWFHLGPCAAGAAPTRAGAAGARVLCAATAHPAVRAARPQMVACPLLPRWPLPAWICFGSWRQRVTVSVADATGTWVGVAYAPPVAAWAPPPRTIAHPRSGQRINLTTGQLLVLGRPIVPAGGRLAPYVSSTPTVLAEVPTPTRPPGAAVFLAVHPGTARLLTTWQPTCAPGQACPDYVVAIVLTVRVLLPVDIPPTA